jgi:hypothetical protein
MMIWTYLLEAPLSVLWGTYPEEELLNHGIADLFLCLGFSLRISGKLLVPPSRKKNMYIPVYYFAFVRSS